jgi:hypothetical protein
MARMVTLSRPHCGLRLNARPSSVGSVIRCKGYGGKIHVTAPSCLAKGLVGCGCLSLFA